MAKMKFDAQKAKQFAIEKAEILGIAVCSLLTTLFLVICILAIFGASSEDRKIAANAKDLQKAIDNAEPPAEADKKDEGGTEKKAPLIAQADITSWPTTAPTAFLTRTPLYDAAALGDPKRRNPSILPVDVADRSGKEKFLQVDFVQAGVKVYAFNTLRGTMSVVEAVGDTKTRVPLNGIRTERMVAVTATFPYDEQIALYIKALRIEGNTEADKVANLFKERLFPKLAGLNVYRRSYDPVTKKASDWEPIYMVEKDGKILVAKAVQQLLKDAVYDELNIAQYGDVYFPTAVTPLPALGDRSWPPLKLSDKAEVVAREDGTAAATGQPKKSVFGNTFGKGSTVGETPKDEGPKLEEKAVKPRDVGRIYLERMQGKINPFNPYGLYPPTVDQSKDDPKEGGPQVFTPLAPSDDEMSRFLPGRKAADKKPDPGAGKGTEDHPYEALMKGVGGATKAGKTVVRFFDTGLQPGLQYQYSIQVRMMNPNFGKTKEVAFPGLALPKELLSPPILTPPVVVPTMSNFYVVDQYPLETTLRGSKTIDLDKRVPLNKAPVQIHQWVEEAGPRGEEKKVCDWAIAERLFVSRGDTIGRKRVEVEVPTWDKLRGAFSLGVVVKAGVVRVGGKFEQKYTRKANVPVDFGQEENGPLVVDFTGGKTQYTMPGIGTIGDDGNLEMLVLMPDGKMILRESRADSDDEDPSGAERARVYAAWAERLRHYRQAGQPTDPKTP